jgi:predicted DNA-binding transcriptional regulator AlpA
VSIEQLLTPEQVAVIFQVAPSWVYEKSRRRCKDPLPALRVGRYLRFRKSDIDRFIESTAPAPRKKRVRQ